MAAHADLFLIVPLCATLLTGAIATVGQVSSPGSGRDLDPLVAVGTTILSLVIYVFAAGIGAITVHRLVLLNDVPPRRLTIAIGWRDLRYTAIVLLYLFTTAAAGVGLGLGIVGATAAEWAGAGAPLVVYCVLIAWAACLLASAPAVGMALSMIAIDQPNWSIRSAIRLCRGNWWRLVAISSSTAAPVLVAILFAIAVPAAIPYLLARFLLAIAIAAVAALAAAVSSAAYRVIASQAQMQSLRAFD